MKRTPGAGISQWQVRAAMAGMATLASKHDVAAQWDAGKPRAKPVQTEHTMQLELGKRLRTRWYFPGVDARDSAHTLLDGANAKQRGVGKGWPDYVLLVPSVRREGQPCLPIRAALELKTPRDCPAAGPDPYLWRHFPDDQKTSHGLAWLQAYRLREYSEQGYRCAVAWDVAWAITWLDAQAGPRPDELPALWVEWARREEL